MSDEDNAADTTEQYEEGKTDPQGRVIDHIYTYHRGHFIVYSRRPEYSLVYRSFNDDENRIAATRLISEVETILSTKMRKQYNGLLANAYVQAHQDRGNTERVETICNNVRNIVQAKTKAYGKLQYISGVITVILLNMIVYLLFPADSKTSSGTLFSKFNRQLFIVAAWGAFGGLISAATRLKGLDIDPNSGFLVNFTDGITKSAVAMLSGVFIYCAVKANLLMGFLANSNSTLSDEILIVVSMLGGISERIVPNTVKQLESVSAGKQIDSST